ncbi:MAG: efflux RND transporter periplasmic adaptor subunit [Smithella sp.]|jgi:RND family efflux transporter MFP subunit
MKMNRFGAGLFLMAALLIMSGCNNKAANEPINVPVPVVAKQIGKINVDQEVSASANIEGRKTVKLGFLVAGKVNYIAADEGAMIEAGQLLASLDPENYKIAKEMADANLNQAQDEYNRLNMMHERKSISDGDFSKISNTLKLAQAQQKLQNKNLSDTKLYAPIKGVLLKKGTEVGEIVGVGLPLFVVSDISIIWVNAAIPENDLQQIKIGTNAAVHISSIDSTFTGKIVEIGSVAEPTTRSFAVKIELKNPGLMIRPGMTAEVKMTTGRKMDIMAVPGEAVLRDPDNTSYVFIADQTRKQAFKRKISLGRMTGSNIEVTSGITPDEWVIVGGQHKLNDGSAIELK